MLIDRLNILDKFNIAHIATRNIDLISGGEAQRVSLARAFLNQNKYVLFDEPFTNLDLLAKQKTAETIKNMIQQNNLCSLIICHEQIQTLYQDANILNLSNDTIILPPI